MSDDHLSELLERREAALLSRNHDELLQVAATLKAMEQIYKQRIIDTKLVLIETEEIIAKFLN